MSAAELLAEVAPLIAKYHAESRGSLGDLSGAMGNAEARAEAARRLSDDPGAQRRCLIDCAAWALAAVCDLDGAARADAPRSGLPPERARQLVKAMLDHADKLRSETHRGGLTDGSDDAYPNGYEQAVKDLARAAGIDLGAAGCT